MTLAEAGTLNYGQMTMKEIEEKFWNNWVVMVNMQNAEDGNETIGGEVYFADEDDLMALKAEHKALYVDNFDESFVVYCGDDRAGKLVALI
jgi:hypothetical protein